MTAAGQTSEAPAPTGPTTALADRLTDRPVDPPRPVLQVIAGSRREEHSPATGCE